MRQQVQDANAQSEIAPAKKHAVRTATVAQHHNNIALERQKEVNSMASTLGNALGNFMEKKHESEAEQKYTQAYLAQGQKEGLSEYQKDLKRTGFTEFIYGGQDPEYLGALDAASRNASDALFIEEANFIEGEGGDMTPEEYQKRLTERVKNFNMDNFDGAPDAAVAFMKNWKDNSNELARQHVKLYKVREQQKARATVAEGFQTSFDKYKTLVDSNPNKAQQLGQDMFSDKYKPQGMSDEAFREVLISESLTAVRAHDYSALKLLNESGIVSTFNEKELKEYETVRGIIDMDNFNMLEASRLDYEEVVENPQSTSVDVRNAQARMESSIQQVAARNTGSTKHLKTVYGADRHRTALGNQWSDRLEKEAKEREARMSKFEKEQTAAALERVVLNESDFKVRVRDADSDKKREIVADRLDKLLIARVNSELKPEVRIAVNDQYAKYKDLLDKWTSQDEAKRKKLEAEATKREKREAELRTGVESLVDGGGYVTADPTAKAQQLQGAVSSVVDQIIPTQDMNTIDKLEQVFSDPNGMMKFIRGSAKFSNYVTDSKDVKQAVANLAASLRGEVDDGNNTWTPAQAQNAQALGVLQQMAPQIYNKSFTASERAELAYINRAISSGKLPAETIRTLDTLQQNVDSKVAFSAKAEDVMGAAGVSGAPADIQNAVFTEYKTHLALGHDEAIRAARSFAQGINTRAGGVTVRYGSTFEPINGHNLDDTMKILSKTYRSGGVMKSGLSRALSSLVGGSTDADGRELYSLKQVPDAKVSLFQGSLVIEQDGRIAVIGRPELENELNGYDEWYRSTGARQATWFD